MNDLKLFLFFYFDFEGFSLREVYQTFTMVIGS